MEIVEALNVYLKTLTVAYRNAHTLHWCVKGKGFRNVHLQLNDMYNDYFEKIDVIGEFIRIHGGIPHGSLKECVDGSLIDEVEAKEYTSEDALKMALEDLLTLIEETNKLAIAAGEAGLKDIDNDVSQFSSDLGKFKYFIESMI